EHYGRLGLAIFLYWMGIGGMLVALFVCRGIVRGRPGRRLIAIRDQEKVAAMMGINVPITKMLAFGVSAALCALAGSLTTVGTGVAAPEALYITVLGSIVFMLVMIVGGAGTLSGPIIGAITYVFLNQYTLDAAASGNAIFDVLFSWARSSPGMVLFGVLLIVLMFVAPSGLAGVGTSLFRRLVVIEKDPDDTQTGTDSGTATLDERVPSASGS
ncbi:MAG TPA: branched-chain amino acid ABC transporter permease, partial [Micromonosporaceae bacterium]